MPRGSVQMFQGAHHFNIGSFSSDIVEGDYYDNGEYSYTNYFSNDNRTSFGAQTAHGNIYNGPISGGINSYDNGSVAYNNNNSSVYGRPSGKRRVTSPSVSTDKSGFNRYQPYTWQRYSPPQNHGEIVEEPEEEPESFGSDQGQNGQYGWPPGAYAPYPQGAPYHQRPHHPNPGAPAWHHANSYGPPATYAPTHVPDGTWQSDSQAHPGLGKKKKRRRKTDGDGFKGPDLSEKMEGMSIDDAEEADQSGSQPTPKIRPIRSQTNPFLPDYNPRAF